MTKAEIRQHYKARRAALSMEEIDQFSQQIAERFFANEIIQAHLNAPGAVVHTYLPIWRQHEADTWPVIRRLWAEWPNVPVLSSVTNVASRTMPMFALTPGTLLVENRWGIPEPAQPIVLAFDVPTLVLIPLLAFDKHGHRVGYGGGYYDRFLAHMPPQTGKIGLSLFPAVPAIDDLERTDVALTGCIEPARLRWWTDVR